ncbi:MAG: hypothetical protein K5752_04480 [Succinivibrionaceae bacterium]|nr:hypothetical protein [Succinivibrionaceae bacterium]
MEEFLNKVLDSYRNQDCKTLLALLTEHGKIEIKLKGRDWDGNVNYRIAAFIVDLQKLIFRAFNDANKTNGKFNFQNIESNNLEIKVEVKKGCSILGFDLNDILKVADKMESSHIAICIIVVIIAFVIKNAITSYFDKEKVKLSNQKEIELHKQMKDVAVNTVNAMLRFGKNLNSNDEIEVNGNKYTKKEFLEKYETNASLEDIELDEYQTFHIDGKYIFDSICIEKKTAKIKLSSKSYSANIENLTEEQIVSLLEQQTASLNKNILSEQDFQLTVKLLAGAVKKLIVDDIGLKRHDSVSFEEAKIQSIENEEQE